MFSCVLFLSLLIHGFHTPNFGCRLVISLRPHPFSPAAPLRRSTFRHLTPSATQSLQCRAIRPAPSCGGGGANQLVPAATEPCAARGSAVLVRRHRIGCVQDDGQGEPSIDVGKDDQKSTQRRMPKSATHAMNFASSLPCAAARPWAAPERRTAPRRCRAALRRDGATRMTLARDRP